MDESFVFFRKKSVKKSGFAAKIPSPLQVQKSAVLWFLFASD